MKASVLMITYNGIKYIEQQILSIIENLESEDELIISDDGSQDGTVELIELYKKHYPNIILVRGPHSGIAANVSNAFQYSSCDILFFSDQDDEWLPGKIKRMKEMFKKNAAINVIMHDGFICDEKNVVTSTNETIFHKRNPKHGVINNIIKSTYYGCCMAFRRSFLEKYMPLSSKLLAYDQFLGLCAEHQRTSFFMDEQFIKHRYHGLNQSNRQSLYNQFKNRAIVFTQYLIYKEGIKK